MPRIRLVEEQKRIKLAKKQWLVVAFLWMLTFCVAAVNNPNMGAFSGFVPGSFFQINANNTAAAGTTNSFAVIHADSGTFSGTVSGLVPITSDTDNTVTLTQADLRGKLRVNADNDAIEYDALDSAAVGSSITLCNSLYAQVITFDPGASDSVILNDGTLLAVGTAAESSGAADDKGTFVKVNSTNWMLFAEQNAWASE